MIFRNLMAIFICLLIFLFGFFLKGNLSLYFNLAGIMIAMATFLFIPFAENIRERTQHELLLQKIIVEGVIAIETEANPRLLETKLQAFLTPSDRSDELVSYHEIIKRFRRKHDEAKAKSVAEIE